MFFAKIFAEARKGQVVFVLSQFLVFGLRTEAESKEKHGVWDPMPELTIASPYVHSRVDSNTFTLGNPMPESTLTLCQIRLYPPVRDFGFSLSELAARHTRSPVTQTQQCSHPDIPPSTAPIFG